MPRGGVSDAVEGWSVRCGLPRRHRWLNNVREALSNARQARTVLGTAGITSEYPVLRLAKDLESVLTYEGMREIHTLSDGAALTEPPALR
jgi:glutaryl-CoA dehydrogenase